MRKALSVFISLLVTVVLLVLLLRQVSFADVAATLGSFPLGYLFLGLVLYVFVQLFRSVRSWFLLRGVVPVKTLFSITCVHNALINTLPARTGELSYVYLLKKTGKVNLGSGVGTLMLARVFDLIALAVLFFGAGLLVSDLPELFLRARVPILVILGVLIILLALIILFNKQAIILAQKICTFIGLGENKWCKWLIAKADEAFHSLHVVKSWQPVGGALVCSLLIWTLLFVINYLIFSGIGITTSFVLVVLASSVFALLTSIPIQGIVGLGTTEAFWTLSLIAIGIASETAIIAGFAQHLIALLYILLLGIYGIFARPQ